MKVALKAFQSPESQKLVRSVPNPARTENPYVMNDTLSAYIEYMRGFGLEVSTDIDTCREIVQDHLAGRGYILENPVDPKELFPKPKKLIKLNRAPK